MVNRHIEFSYSHTQIGWLSIATMGIAVGAIVFVMFAAPYNIVAFLIMSVVLAVFVTCLILFSFMTISVNGGYLVIRIGPAIRKSLSFEKIESCRVIKVPWYYGWGIRIVPHGWLYRVSGFHAVEIIMKDGSRYLVGTDEPQKLAAFINERLSGSKAESL